MTTMSNYFEQAQLSRAAYASGLKPGMPILDYRHALEEGEMSAMQAEEFANTYSVIDQYTDPMTGFSGTAFLNVDTGQVHLVIRGSDDVRDWVGTNFGYIATDGIAITQGIAMFNWLQRLLGARNSNVVRYVYVEDYVDQETGEFFPARIVSRVEPPPISVLSTLTRCPRNQGRFILLHHALTGCPTGPTSQDGRREATCDDP